MVVRVQEQMSSSQFRGSLALAFKFASTLCRSLLCNLQWPRATKYFTIYNSSTNCYYTPFLNSLSLSIYLRKSTGMENSSSSSHLFLALIVACILLWTPSWARPLHSPVTCRSADPPTWCMTFQEHKTRPAIASLSSPLNLSSSNDTDLRFGMEKRVVPTGPNPLHNWCALSIRFFNGFLFYSCIGCWCILCLGVN